MAAPVPSPWYPSLTLHLILLPIITFFQCKRPRFLSCFSDFHSILSLSCHTALAAVPLPLDSKMPSRVSQGIHQQRVTEGGKLSKVLRSQVDRPGSCVRRVGSQCMDFPLPLPMQVDSCAGPPDSQHLGKRGKRRIYSKWTPFPLLIRLHPDLMNNPRMH